MPNQQGPGPQYFTWNGQQYYAPGDGTLYRVDGVQKIRTTDGSDLAAAQAWWETQLPVTTYNADGTAFTGPGRGVLDPNRQSGNSSTLLILGAGLLFVILVARR